MMGTPININSLLRDKKFVELQNFLLDEYFKHQKIEDIVNVLDVMLNRGYADKVIPIAQQLLNIRVEYNLLMLLGKIQKLNKNYDEAFETYSKAKAIKRDSIDPIFSIGVVRQNQGRTEEAIEYFKNVIEIKNDTPEAYYNLGNIYRTLKDYENAELFYKKCLDISLQNAECYYNLGVVLEKQFKYEDALKYYNKAISINPHLVDAHWNKALLLLTLGDYKNGWREYEWRLQKKEYQRNDLQFRYWKGENLNEKKILVYDEQGFGDTFQFSRFVRLLGNGYSVDVSFECKEEIYPLFKQSKNFKHIYIRGKKKYSRDEFDYKVSLLSLPFLLNIDKETTKVSKPYIETESKDSMLPVFISKKLKVGFVWQGNPENQNDKYRSIDVNQLIAELGDTEVQLYSLQKRNKNDNFIDEIFAKFKVIDLNKNFIDTANLITQLDLIITVDTSVAHLAAAMMKPVWIMLSANPDWRWGLSGETTSWYPTVKLFRQKILGEWGGVFKNIAEELYTLKLNSVNQSIQIMMKQAINYFNQSLFNKATEIFEGIIKIEKSDETIFNNLAICYQNLGLYHKSIDNCSESIKLNENYLAAYNTLSINYYKLGNKGKAVETLIIALSKNSSDADTLFNLANIHHQTGDLIFADNYYEQAYKIKEHTANLIYNYALLLIELNNYEKAQKIVDKGRTEYPTESSLLFLSGNIEKYYEKFYNAEKFFLSAIQINPNYIDAYINLANTYYLMHNFNGARKIYSLLNSKNIDDARIDYSLGVIALEENEINKSETHFRQAIFKDKDNTDFHVALSEVLFAKGDYKNGWDEFEWRFKRKEFKNKKILLPNKLSELEDKNILIYEEQGIGDTFQFIRFAKKIKSINNKITFSARKEIMNLIGELDYVDAVVDKYVDSNQFDYVFSLMSIAKYFVQEINDIEPAGKYIYSNNLSTEAAEHFVFKDKLNVGICWRGNRFPVHNRKRHTEIQNFESLFSNKMVMFYSLQKDISEEEKNVLNGYENVFDLSSRLSTFNETAAFCSQMDLIISIDTSILHLAGAMRKPTWALLPYSPDWRWQIEQEKSPWYLTMKIFRQETLFVWENVFDLVKNELKIFKKPK